MRHPGRSQQPALKTGGFKQPLHGKEDAVKSAVLLIFTESEMAVFPEHLKYNALPNSFILPPDCHADVQVCNVTSVIHLCNRCSAHILSTLEKCLRDFASA